MLCTESSNYTNLIIAIETFCRRYKVCEKDFKKKLIEFKAKIEVQSFKQPSQNGELSNHTHL